MASSDRNLYEAYQHKQVFSNEDDVVESSYGTAKNGVLMQVPASVVRLETKSEIEHHAESSTEQSKKRKLSKSVQGDGAVEAQKDACDKTSSTQTQPDVVEDKRYLFRLFKVTGTDKQYILEEIEVERNISTKYHLSVVVSDNGKWTLNKRHFRKEQRDMFPVMEDPLSPIFPERCDVPLHERLDGWFMRETTRSKTTRSKTTRSKPRSDKLYYRGTTKCRSLVEVSKYILYSYKEKKRIPVRRVRRETPQEVQETKEVDTITGGVNLQNLNVGDPPMENPAENIIRNDNLIHANFDGGVDIQNQNVGDPPMENPVIPTENYLAIENHDNYDEVAVGDLETFAGLDDIEELHDFAGENPITMSLPR